MREDMKFVVLDRPRLNHDFRICKGERRKLQCDWETLPQRESMKVHWHFHRRYKAQRLVGRVDRRKEFNDHLAPLRRFLKTRLGSDWNDLNSEIRQEASTRTVLGFHLMHHFWRMIRRNVFVVDGVVFSNRCQQLSSGTFFIDPTSNKLCCIGS